MAKILFLEDEQTILEVTTEYMSMQHQVTTATNGQEALVILEKESFDLAILDIMVPKINGLEVLNYISTHHPQSATIMLTALDDEETQLKAFNSFADDYIIKPFSPLLLLKRIDAVLRRTNTKPTAMSNDLVIDDKTYQAYYGQKSLQLTLTEFLLLQKLNSDPFRVFTRENLLNHIFPNDYFANDRVIDAHVKNLRKKLPKNYIKTVTGVGYQMESEM